MKTPRPRLKSPLTTTILYLLFLLGAHPSEYAQQVHTSLNGDTFVPAHELIAPTLPIVLMVGGMVASQEDIRSPVQQWIPAFLSDQYTWEDYVQHSAYLLWGVTWIDAGVSSRRIVKQGLYLFSITAANALVTAGLKAAFRTRRPNGGLYAFPSGHTSHAFATATAFYLLVYPKYPILRYASFALASSVAIGRVIHNRHWVGDVLFGAGLGIILPIALDRYLVPLRYHPTKSSSKALSFFALPNAMGIRYSL